MKSKFKCPACNHSFSKCGREVSTTLRFCVCEYCLVGIWIDIKTGVDGFGRIYSTSRYDYCKCRPPELQLSSNPIRCKKCEKLIHIDRIKSIKMDRKNDD